MTHFNPTFCRTMAQSDELTIFDNEPADTDFQRGYKTALAEIIGGKG